MDNENRIVFDIGGTWFRSGFYTQSSGLSLLTKQPAYNYRNTIYKTIPELQLKLVDYLIKQVNNFRHQNHHADVASISMGAALNGHSGEILNSGPLWGPESKPFDLLASLNAKMPDIHWIITNDVSAALLRYANSSKYSALKRISLITISSGIACRTYDQQHKYIPLNKSGLQGEIGHIPIQFSMANNIAEARCDCGGQSILI